MTNIATLVPPPQKGERRGGRVAGVQNRHTRAMKLAMVEAAEESKHAEHRGQSLKAYCLFLADEHPTVFANMLARLIPIQAKVTTNGPPLRLDPSMSMEELIRNFEAKIKDVNYRPLPRMLEQDDVEVDDAT